MNTTIDELVDDGLQVGGLELGKRSDGFSPKSDVSRFWLVMLVSCLGRCGLDLKSTELKIQLEILRPSIVDDRVLLQNCSCQKSIF